MTQIQLRDIFIAALARKRDGADELRTYIMRGARANGHSIHKATSGDTFEIVFESGRVISYDGDELHLI
jgi:hypothetical protein